MPTIAPEEASSTYNSSVLDELTAQKMYPMPAMDAKVTRSTEDTVAGSACPTIAFDVGLNDHTCARPDTRPPSASQSSVPSLVRSTRSFHGIAPSTPSTELATGEGDVAIGTPCTATIFCVAEVTDARSPPIAVIGPTAAGSIIQRPGPGVSVGSITFTPSSARTLDAFQ